MAYKEKTKKRSSLIPGFKKRKIKRVEDPIDTMVANSSKTSHAILSKSPKAPGSELLLELSFPEKQKAVAEKRNSWAKATTFLRYTFSINKPIPRSTVIDEQKEAARGLAEQAIQDVEYHGDIDGVPTFGNKGGGGLLKKAR